MEAILEIWAGVIGSPLFLVHYFRNVPDGQPIAASLEAVHERFGRRLLGTAGADSLRAWIKSVILPGTLWRYP